MKKIRGDEVKEGIRNFDVVVDGREWIIKLVPVLLWTRSGFGLE